MTASGLLQFHRLELPLPLQLAHINCYLLQGPAPHRLALVDTGMATPEARGALVAGLEALGRRPDQITQVFVTHYHLDHFGQVGWLQGELGAAVIMPRVDGQHLQRYLHEPGYDEEALSFFGAHGVPEDALARSRAGLARMRAAAPIFTPDRLVDDGEVIELAGAPLEVIETPGHSPGHACLHHRASGTLLVGDHVLPHITPNVTLSKGSPPDPLTAYRASLTKIRGRGFARTLPAHGPQIADLDARIDAILAHHVQREQELLALLEQRPQTAYELAAALFELDALDGWETWMAVGEALAHIVALINEGRVEQARRGGVTRYARPTSGRPWATGEGRERTDDEPR